MNMNRSLSSLTRESVLSAIAEFDRLGREDFLSKYKFGRAKEFFLLLNENRYDSKAICGAAFGYADRGAAPLSAAEFSGGELTVQRALEHLGFQVIRDPRGVEYPLESFSWEISSSDVAIKRMDRSSFLHHGSGVPHDIGSFFGLSAASLHDRKDITLLHSTKQYAAHLQPDPTHSRFRLFWRADFSRLIQSLFPDVHAAYRHHTDVPEHAPQMRFHRLSSTEFHIEFLNPAVIAGNPEHEAMTAQEAEEERIESLIKKDPGISETEKEALIKARNGQGQFRDAVLSLHGRCPFTAVCNPRFLRAGHLKPWSKCESNQERLSPLNGIPLTPVADILVDQGLATFTSDGIALFSPLLKPNEAEAMGIDVTREYRITIFNEEQRGYLAYHRTHVYRAEV